MDKLKTELEAHPEMAKLQEELCAFQSEFEALLESREKLRVDVERLGKSQDDPTSE
ncbi:MAG: hypothetical protein OSB41_11605 [Kiritimatiellae bacterium]|nr:hypothetical protein [Kiritimatiellia bacterium]